MQPRLYSVSFWNVKMTYCVALKEKEGLVKVICRLYNCLSLFLLLHVSPRASKIKQMQSSIKNDWILAPLFFLLFLWTLMSTLSVMTREKSLPNIRSF